MNHKTCESLKQKPMLSRPQSGVTLFKNSHPSSSYGLPLKKSKVTQKLKVQEMNDIINQVINQNQTVTDC